MVCYLCNGASFVLREGRVRDDANLKVLECTGCGLVQLDSFEHIRSGFYEESGMHGANQVPMESWLRDTEWDDRRRFEMLMPVLPNHRVLDFGCGAGGLLQRASDLAAAVVGVELEERVRTYWDGRIQIVADIDQAGEQWDLITAFHVVEHLPDPVSMLKKMGSRLSENGRLVVEVPSANDALLGLYDSDDFQKFTYWSQHLFLFTPDTLRRVAERAGLQVVSIQQYQRYPLSNHLHWLSKGKPGGHQKWSFLDSPELSAAYSAALASIGQCDTLIAHLQRAD
jgi:2-polyprenyl-3-methyl-5-hydroxy-6-metoxy-1,4-benzoquinol methylase